MSDANGYVRVNRAEGGIAIVTLDRPERLNALGVAGKEALGAAWRELDADETVGAIVLTGAGERAFCAGSDLREMAATGRTASTETLLNAIPGIGVEMSTPVIAAVHGYCIGMGVTLVLHADQVIAAPAATFSLPEVTHGALSAVTAVRLPSLLSHGRAMRMLLEGIVLDADHAREWGFVHDITPDPLTAALDRARALATLPRTAVRETTRLMRVSARAQALAAVADITTARTRAESAEDFTTATNTFAERS